MHYMNSEFDAGDIIAQRRVPIGPEDTWLDVRGRVAAATESSCAKKFHG
jgi:methionyl-tRNA formyltransferase